MYLFDVEPMGAVRMTQSDKWSHRPEVDRYFGYKQELQLKANILKYRLGNRIHIDFYIAMPKSWSKSEKDRMRGQPCKAKPDTDNLLKGFTDALTSEDSRIWEMLGRKYWADKGSISVVLNEFDADEDPTAIKITIYDIRSKTKYERKNVKVGAEALAARRVSIPRR